MSSGYPPVTASLDLSESETRVLGCLLEKQRTTPDVYPLSLNSLRLACNQSTNRDPVVDYDDAVIRDALHRLERRGFTRLASGAGSRTAKYRHLLAEALPMAGAEQAIVCVLMLRGPQTPGELKQRAERMHPFGELVEVHETLQALIDRGLVARLERRPGHKEERYAQLLQSGGEEQAPAPAPIVAAAVEASGEPAALAPHEDLRERVGRLEREVAELREALGLSVGETRA
jgi:uncharacterized protein YceH (UPF0502 family)